MKNLSIVKIGIAQVVAGAIILLVGTEVVTEAAMAGGAGVITMILGILRDKGIVK